MPPLQNILLDQSSLLLLVTLICADSLSYLVTILVMRLSRSHLPFKNNNKGPQLSTTSRYLSKLGKRIVILEQLRTVSAIAEERYQIFYLVLSPSYFYKILKAYCTLYKSMLINKLRNTFELSLIWLKHICPPRLFKILILPIYLVSITGLESSLVLFFH